MEQTLLTVHKQTQSKAINLSVFRDAMVGFLMSLIVGIASACILAVLVMLLSLPANAAQQSIDYDTISQGTLYLNLQGLEDYEESMLLRTQVNVDINGLVARTRVSQMFTNQSNEWLEGVYVFPLPENAAVDHMKMFVGDRIIEGQIQEKENAKKTYEKAKREGKRASIAEQQRPNLFTTKLANIAPGDIIEIQIEYQQTLAYGVENGQGKLSLRYPMAVSPRYSPGNTLLASNVASVKTVQGDINTDTVSPKYSDNDTTNLTSIDIDLKSGFPISNIVSDYHEIVTQHDDLSHAMISLSQDRIPANQDFVLSWYLEPGSDLSAAQFSEQVGNEYYHLVMVMPPTEGIAGVQPLAREIIYIVDTSGSMEGESLNQAKNALLTALEQIRDFDTFNIIQFNSETQQLFNDAKTANSDNLEAARDYVKSLVSGGGTEMYPALSAALEQNSPSDRIRQIIFLTDGGVNNEKALFELIDTQLGESRLFTVGIGSAPNSYFMRKSAQFGRGTFTYIAEINEVQEKMQALFAKLESPVLSDIEIHFTDLENVEYWPRRIPDLYLGEPLVLSIKTHTLKGRVLLSGKRANNQWVTELDLTQASKSEGLGVLWAREKIADLMDSVATGADKDDVRQHIITTALRHHIVSKYTSLVAVDLTPVRSEFDALKKTQIANTIPKGNMQGRLSQTATPMQAYIALGLSLLLLAAVLALFRDKLMDSLSHYSHVPLNNNCICSPDWTIRIFRG